MKIKWNKLLDKNTREINISEWSKIANDKRMLKLLISKRLIGEDLLSSSDPHERYIILLNAYYSMGLIFREMFREVLDEIFQTALYEQNLTQRLESKSDSSYYFLSNLFTLLKNIKIDNCNFFAYNWLIDNMTMPLPNCNIKIYEKVDNNDNWKIFLTDMLYIADQYQNADKTFLLQLHKDL